VPGGFEERLRKQVDIIKGRSPRAKLLRPNEAANSSVIGAACLFYSQLSSDAAHPSITVLKRHMVRFE
jgi:hypothetical protein